MVRDVSEISWGAGRQCSLFSASYPPPPTPELGAGKGLFDLWLTGLNIFALLVRFRRSRMLGLKEAK
ncbi:hypothetical protein CEXT_697671 [Caerostris extrusa]|uniref:Uncharacterized protein n=1 Tax=Caerostris extrusa TaxID=172846 RepID=A0AAV4TCF1_CAEEX|nr:hypothetical protein CEXT_697671 [Caerostris extrusa]